MRITDATTPKPELQAAIDSAGLFLARQSNGNIVVCGSLPNITLRVLDSSGAYARRAASGRKAIGANWHAHRMFLDIVFALCPNAKVRTSLATYRGAADYSATYKKTAETVMQHCGRAIAFGDL